MDEAIEDILQKFRGSIVPYAATLIQTVKARANTVVANRVLQTMRERKASLARVARQRSDLEKEKSAMQDIQARQESRVELLVGGKRFVTSLVTLRSKTGMLQALFSGRYEPDACEDSGVFFLDRDGDLFGYVLDYLRTGVLPVVEEMGLYRRLSREFDFLHLGPLTGQRGMFILSGGDIVMQPRILLVNESSGKCWRTPPLSARRWHGACSVGRVVYMIGGRGHQTQPLASVESHTLRVEDGVPTGGQCTMLSPMPEGRTWLARQTVVVGGTIFVLGGAVGSNLDAHNWVHTRSVLRYHPASDSWAECTQIPSDASFIATCAVGAVIYVFGGQEGYTRSEFIDGLAIPVYSKKVYKYNTVRYEWSECEPMPMRLQQWHSATLLGGDVYVIGASCETWSDYMWRYNPAQDTWSPAAEPLFENDEYTVPFVVGGRICVYQEDSLYTYEPLVDSWSVEEARLPSDSYTSSVTC